MAVALFTITLNRPDRSYTGRLCHRKTSDRSNLDKVPGLATHNINANDLIWDFFVKHPMP
jgi:hypothetical protein